MPSEIDRLVERRLTSLLGHLMIGLFMAASFSVIALVVFGAEALDATFAHAHRAEKLREAGLGLILVLSSYFAAGLVGAFGVWLLRPLRRYMIGWILTGILTVVVIYGAVGLTSVLGYIHLGVSLVDYSSPHDAWSSLPGMLVAVSLAAGIPGGIYGWWRAKHGLSFFD